MAKTFTGNIRAHAIRLLDGGLTVAETADSLSVTKDTVLRWQRAAAAVREGMPPRRFQLMRDEDVSGVSGTGVVADGVEFPDGSVALRFRGDWPTTNPHPSIESVIGVHGHGGKTRVVWLDARPMVA